MKLLFAAALVLGLVTAPAMAKSRHYAASQVQSAYTETVTQTYQPPRNPLSNILGFGAEVADDVVDGAKTVYRAGRGVVQGSWQALATRVAQEEGVSPALVHAVVKVESGGNCRATSSANARGIMQVKPATARGVGVTGNLHDCHTGMRAGVRYLKEALRVNRGNLCAAASSYNTGTGITGRCSGYGRKVLAHMGRYQRVASLAE
jgi:soluble lytic murein transglycosylase-like protein